MIYTINRYNKIKSCLMLDPTLFTEAKSQAAKMHLTLGNVVELALKDYLDKAKAQEQEKTKQEDQSRKEEEEAEVKRFNESGRGIPPSIIFRHYEGNE
jgi:hypothetical protein